MGEILSMELNGFPSAKKRHLPPSRSSVLCLPYGLSTVALAQVEALAKGDLSSFTLSLVCRHILLPARRSRCKRRPLSAPRIVRRANIRRFDTYCTSLLFLLFDVYRLANPVIRLNHSVSLWQLLARYNHRRVIQLEFHDVVFVAGI